VLLRDELDGHRPRPQSTSARLLAPESTPSAAPVPGARCPVPGLLERDIYLRACDAGTRGSARGRAAEQHLHEECFALLRARPELAERRRCMRPQAAPPPAASQRDRRAQRSLVRGTQREHGREGGDRLGAVVAQDRRVLAAAFEPDVIGVAVQDDAHPGQLAALAVPHLQQGAHRVLGHRHPVVRPGPHATVATDDDADRRCRSASSSASGPSRRTGGQEVAEGLGVAV